MFNKPGPKSPHGKVRVVQGTQRQKIWLAMQIKRKFSIADLCRCVLTGGETAKDPRNNIARYVAGLAKIGVLLEMKRRMAPTSPTSNGEKRWLLVRDLGRKAPVISASGAVYDPNSATVIPLPVIDAEVGHDQ